MSEADEQAAVVEWCDLHHVPCFHIPNGGLRDPRTAAGLKRQGVKAGVPDLCVPVPKGKYHSLYIEMKYGRNKPTAQQVKWLTYLQHAGFCAYVCYGADDAIALLERYLSL